MNVRAGINAVLAYIRRLPARASASIRNRCAAQHVATPTIILNFREENFHDQKSNHEIHENIVPQKIWSYTVIAVA